MPITVVPSGTLTYSTLMSDLLTKLSTFSQLSTVKVGGSIRDLPNPLDGSSVVYPYCFIINDKWFVNRNYSSGTLVCNLSFSIMDQYIVGATNSQQTMIDVQSNMFQVATDLIDTYNMRSGTGAAIDGTPYYIESPAKITITPFTMYNVDNVAGVKFTLPFLIQQGPSRTNIPLKN